MLTTKLNLATPKLPIIITDAAKADMRRLHVPPFAVLAIARKANDAGDGLYATGHNNIMVIVQDRTIDCMN